MRHRVLCSHLTCTPSSSPHHCSSKSRKGTRGPPAYSSYNLFLLPHALAHQNANMTEETISLHCSTYKHADQHLNTVERSSHACTQICRWTVVLYLRSVHLPLSALQLSSPLISRHWRQLKPTGSGEPSACCMPAACSYKRARDRGACGGSSVA